MTGKNKERFDKWCLYNNLPYKHGFDICDFRCKIGVYLDYYDSIGVDVNVDRMGTDYYDYEVMLHRSSDTNEYSTEEYTTRQLAYVAAFEKANGLVNKEG